MDVKSGRWCVPRLLGPPRAPVPVAVHLEQFAPLLVQYFGEPWWRRGSLSVRAISTTVSGEPVCCYLETGAAQRCRVWMNAEGEELILEGTAALGEDRSSALLEDLDDATPGEAARVLVQTRPGRTSGRLPVRISEAEVDRRLAVITEPMGCYRGDAAFGGRVVPSAAAVLAMQAVEPEIAPVEGQLQRIVGGLEVRHLAGPVLCERDYLVQGRVLAVSATARDETVWYQADLCEAQSEAQVACMIHMERFSQGTLPLSHLVQH